MINQRLYHELLRENIEKIFQHPKTQCVVECIQIMLKFLTLFIFFPNQVKI